jgi:hypothetical protein
MRKYGIYFLVVEECKLVVPYWYPALESNKGTVPLQVPQAPRAIAYPPTEPTGPVGYLRYCLGFLWSFWLPGFLSDPSAYPPVLLQNPQVL